jgi:hypothetical protein
LFFGGELLLAAKEEDEGVIAHPLEVEAIAALAAAVFLRCRFALGFGSSTDEEVLLFAV